MSRITAFVILACATVAVSVARPRADGRSQEENPCQVVEEALSTSHEIKPGMTRREVEKRFDRDGGMQFPSETTYVYPKCDYIKLRIEFKPAPSRADALSPDDTVISTSNLFVAYPAMD